MFNIRPITASDNAAVAAIIRSVMTEFGASGPGFAIHDTEVDCMFETYADAGSAYFVIEQDGRVCGGGGIAPLVAKDKICELRKMYFLPQLRGVGAGGALISKCLNAARGLSYRQCYLETLTGMDAAQHLYTTHGFAPVAAPLGNTGHFGCNRFYLRDL
jgi:putative acetyltransferase